MRNSIQLSKHRCPVSSRVCFPEKRPMACSGTVWFGFFWWCSMGRDDPMWVSQIT